MSTSLQQLETLWKSQPGGLLFAPLAEALHRADRADEALAVLSEGLQRWPRHVTGRVLYGRIAAERGDMETARSSFQSALQLDDRCWAALQGLADALTRLQYVRQAGDAWSRLAVLDPTDARASEAALKAASQFEASSALADLGMGVRDQEDDQAREALSEGTSARARDDLGLALDLADFGEPAPARASAAAPRLDDPFDLDELKLPMDPPPISASQAIPVAPAPAPIPVPSAPPVAKPASPASELQLVDESGFATLEMAAFPSRTIPPPPLEMAKPPLPEANESGTRVMSPVRPPVPTLPPDLAVPDATLELRRDAVAPSAQPPVTGSDIGDRLDALFGESTIPTFPASNETQVSGRDIEARLDDLFGEEEVPATGSATQASASPLPSPAATLATEVAPAPSATTASPSGPVTGDDIGDRLDALFGDEAPAIAPALLAPPPRPASPASTLDLSVEAPAPRTTPAPVTGDDIGDRLDALFGDEAPVVAPVPSTPPPRPASPASTLDLPVEAPAPARTSSAPVTGDDIGDRLDALFGDEDATTRPVESGSTVDLPVVSAASFGVEEGTATTATPRMAPEDEAGATMAFPLQSAGGRDVEVRLDSMFGDGAAAPEIRDDYSRSDETSAVDRTVIDSAVDAPTMDFPTFETQGIARPFALESDFSSSSDAPITLPDEPRSDKDTAALAMDTQTVGSDSQVDPGGSTIDLPTISAGHPSPTSASGRLVPPQDVDSELDELFASSEFLDVQAPPPRPVAAPRPVSDPGVVTGLDIEDRLDDIFGIESDFPVGVPTATLAEEYLRQGHRDHAVQVYRQLLQREPGNADVARRLAEIEAQGR